jgi:NitT/TauT family transport system permease protein
MRSIWLARLLFAAALLGAWQFSSGRYISALYVSSPSAIGAKLMELIADGELFRHMWITALEAGLGFLLGGGAGVLTGLVLGRARRVAEVLDPFLMGFYSLPKIALAPLFVMWFGIDVEMKIIFAAAIVFLMVFLNTYSGVRSVSRELITIFRLMGASERQVIAKVVVPAAMTWVFAGLRLSVPYALVGAIIGELIAANRGLGYLVERATTQFDTAGAFAAIAAIIFLSVVLNALVSWIERRLMPWRSVDESREMAV